ncbi:MAG: cytochrome b/b6 domain-containing protein [Bacteroidota bacterium]
MVKKIYLYPRWLRLWHTVNALMFIILIVSGISMQYASLENPIIQFDIAVRLHNFGGVILTLSYSIFLVGNVFTSNGRYYKIVKQELGEPVKKQFRYYLSGIFKGELHPYPVTKDRKFNPLQKITYILVMYIGVPVMVITGWALLFPEIIVHNVFGTGGIFLTALFHVIAGFLLSVFMIIHIYFATIGHSVSSNFKAIVTGYHETEKE